MTEIWTGFKEQILECIHTNIPAQIIEFDPVKMEATIQILAKLKIRGIEQVPKAIYRVPVGHGRCTTFAERFPLQKGDLVLISFSEVSLETIMNSENPEIPLGDSKFDLTDAIITTCLSKRGATLPNENQDDYMLFNIETGHKIIFKKTGEIEVSSPRILIKAEEEISIDTPVINAPKSQFNVKSVKATSIITDTFNAVKSALIKGIDFLSHVHSGVQAGNDDTGGPK